MRKFLVFMIVMATMTLMLQTTSCKSSPKVNFEEAIVIPKPPAAYDINRKPYVKSKEEYIYMPAWKWDEFLKYIASSQVCMKELEDMIIFIKQGMEKDNNKF